jgi:hypothetical protein
MIYRETEEDRVKRLIEDARDKMVIAQAAEDNAISFARSFVGTYDLSEYPSDGENASNLEEAIICYIDYGEYDIDSLIKELREIRA